MVRQVIRNVGRRIEKNFELNFFSKNVDFPQDLPCPGHPRTSLALTIQEPLHTTGANFHSRLPPLIISTFFHPVITLPYSETANTRGFYSSTISVYLLLAGDVA